MLEDTGPDRIWDVISLNMQAAACGWPSMVGEPWKQQGIMC